MKLPFLSFTTHSCRNLARAQHLPCSGSRLFLLYHQRGRLNKVYFTRKLLFSHIPQHISGWQTKSFPLFYIHFTLYHLGCGMPPLTRPALPWPRAPYRPKTGTHHCRCIPPHDCPHNATQNPSWCFPPVCLFYSRDFPGEHSIAQFRYHKKDFQLFSQTFYAKSSVCYPSLLTPFAATFLGNRVFGSFPSQRRISAGNRRRSCRFPSRPPPVKMG